MVVEESEPSDEGQHEAYQLVRPAGKMETIFTLYGELGIQSNVIVAAKYAHRGDSAGALNRNTLYPALRKLIDEHWALRLVLVERAAASSKNGMHEYWEAQLQQIDLDQIVEFAEVDDSDGLDRYIETQHNTWIDTRTETSVPFWRLKVLNGRHVVFVYSHAICDGMSGYAFHRRLLVKLNEPGSSTDHNVLSVFEPAAAEPPAVWLKDFPAKFSLLKLLCDVLFMHFVRLFYRGSIMFDDVPIDKSSPPLEQRSKKEKVYCKTVIRSLRIPPLLLLKLLAACKRKNTTFGSLLHVVSVATMAKDLYPDAKITLAASPFSTRPWTVPVQGKDLMVNSASSNMRVHRLGPYRAAASAPSGSSEVYIDADRAWALSTAYTQHFRRGLSSLSMFNGSLAGALYPDEIESVYKNFFPNVWLYQRFFTAVSNLGVFSTNSTGGSWQIRDLQFSVAAVRSNWGFAAPVFNVASISEGDCVITCTMEEGLIDATVIENILAGIEKRLSLLAASEK